jgi:hypothetical protein
MWDSESELTEKLNLEAEEDRGADQSKKRFQISANTLEKK